MEDLLYEVESVRRFAGLTLSDPLPDKTTILKFTQLLGAHDPGEALVRGDQRALGGQGSQPAARDDRGRRASSTRPSSTKNRAGKRDPEMHQTKNGNKRCFGMNAHTGVDVESGPAHSPATTPANESDVATAHEVLHGDEEEEYGDADYQSVGKR